MDSKDLKFDPANKIHLELAKTSQQLEEKMRQTVRAYLSHEKELTLSSVDDTDQSPEVPSTISSALMRRIDALDDLEKLEDCVTKMI